MMVPPTTKNNTKTSTGIPRNSHSKMLTGVSLLRRCSGSTGARDQCDQLRRARIFGSSASRLERLTCARKSGGIRGPCVRVQSSPHTVLAGPHPRTAPPPRLRRRHHRRPRHRPVPPRHRCGRRHEPHGHQERRRRIRPIHRMTGHLVERPSSLGDAHADRLV
jgi:hypothetical protein